MDLLDQDLKATFWEFPGSPLIKTLLSHCWRPGVQSLIGELKNPVSYMMWPKNKIKKIKLPFGKNSNIHKNCNKVNFQFQQPSAFHQSCFIYCLIPKSTYWRLLKKIWNMFWRKSQQGLLTPCSGIRREEEVQNALRSVAQATRRRSCPWLAEWTDVGH